MSSWCCWWAWFSYPTSTILPDSWGFDCFAVLPFTFFQSHINPFLKIKPAILSSYSSLFFCLPFHNISIHPLQFITFSSPPFPPHSVATLPCSLVTRLQNFFHFCTNHKACFQYVEAKTHDTWHNMWDDLKSTFTKASIKWVANHYPILFYHWYRTLKKAYFFTCTILLSIGKEANLFQQNCTEHNFSSARIDIMNKPKFLHSLSKSFCVKLMVFSNKA